MFTVDGKDMKLIQLTESFDGTNQGLYLLPKNVPIDVFDDEILSYVDQTIFDATNKCGAVRIYAEQSLLDLKFS